MFVTAIGLKCFLLTDVDLYWFYGFEQKNVPDLSSQSLPLQVPGSTFPFKSQVGLGVPALWGFLCCRCVAKTVMTAYNWVRPYKSLGYFIWSLAAYWATSSCPCLKAEVFAARWSGGVPTHLQTHHGEEGPEPLDAFGAPGRFNLPVMAIRKNDDHWIWGHPIFRQTHFSVYQNHHLTCTYIYIYIGPTLHVIWVFLSRTDSESKKVRKCGA